MQLCDGAPSSSGVGQGERSAQELQQQEATGANSLGLSATGYRQAPGKCPPAD